MKTLFDQAIEIIEAGGSESQLNILLNNKCNSFEMNFYRVTVGIDSISDISDDYFYDIRLLRLLLARELWNDGQEKYWKQGLFK